MISEVIALTDLGFSVVCAEVMQVSLKLLGRFVLDGPGEQAWALVRGRRNAQPNDVLPAVGAEHDIFTKTKSRQVMLPLN